MAAAALKAAGARPGSNYVWGTRVNQITEVKPGDIVQMFNARFENPDGSSTWSTGPHTAVITAVNGTELNVLEQNVAGSPVQAGKLDLRYMKGGSLAIYRPQATAGINNLSNYSGPITR